MHVFIVTIPYFIFIIYAYHFTRTANDASGNQCLVAFIANIWKHIFSYDNLIASTMHALNWLSFYVFFNFNVDLHVLKNVVLPRWMYQQQFIASTFVLTGNTHYLVDLLPLSLYFFSFSSVFHFWHMICLCMLSRPLSFALFYFSPLSLLITPQGQSARVGLYFVQ